MFVDARNVDDGHRFESDVCIIGAGAAGITLASALAKSGLRVDLVESGGRELETETQQLYRTELRGDPYPDPVLSRLRYYGGTTNHWGGACRPLSGFEFGSHPWVPHSGWPITRKDLNPYYDAARGVLGLPRRHFRFDPGEQNAKDLPPILGENAKIFASMIWRRTQPGPARLGPMHASEIETSEKIRCVLHANAKELNPNEGTSAVESLQAATLTGRRLTFRARRFVLCAGAIETARLLLLSDSRVPGGLGNQNDLVGRYFSDHGFGNLGELLVAKRPTARWFREESFFLAKQGAAGPIDLAGFAGTPALREGHRVLGFSMIGFVWKRNRAAYRSAAAVQELISGPPARGAEDYSGVDVEPDRWIPLTYICEKAPNPESRVRLSEEKDALGLRKASIDFRLSELDWASVRENARVFALSVGRSGNGRVRLRDFDGEPWCLGVGGHQTGTARMSDDPKQGVTDRNGRVHGLANLYVASGALFPTAGWQHPTFTIVALALRLGDHLSRQPTDGMS